MKRPFFKALALSAALALAALSLGQRPGDLVVTPTRILLHDKARVADITLVNRGSEKARYRLSLVDMEMSEAGVLKRIPASANSAANSLRLSPREIVLEPGASQRIKIAISPTAALPEGELRSHLAFEPISTPKAPGQQNSGGALKLSFELRSAVTIPVIVQHGQLSATASISEPEITQDSEGWIAKFVLSRSGNRTVRGDVFVTFKPRSGGEKVVIGQITALPVYFPNASRLVTVKLTRDIRSLGKGDFEISFAEVERPRGATAARIAVELKR